jgi:hypothetical protein
MKTTFQQSPCQWLKVTVSGILFISLDLFLVLKAIFRFLWVFFEPVQHVRVVNLDVNYLWN